MNKLLTIFTAILLVIIVGLFVRMVLDQDDSVVPSKDDDRIALAEWMALDDIERNIVCNLWADAKAGDEVAIALIESMPATNTDEGVAAAKVAIMERECDEYL
jgi:hypothetical protein